MSANLNGLQKELVQAWEQSDALFDLLRPEAWYARPIPLRQPFCFYLGHLPAFAFNQVGVAVLGLAPLHREYCELFEFGIDPLEKPDGPPAQWPTIPQIRAFRDDCRSRVLELFDDVASLDSHDPLAANGRVFDMVIEHELMHQETLVYMIAALDHTQKTAPSSYALPPHRPAPAQQSIYIPAGPIRLGADWRSAPFLWDNETPAYSVDVRGFHMDRYPVSNGDFARFVAAGAYENPDLWDDEGWDFIRKHGLEKPHLWHGAGDQLTVRSTFEDVAFARAASWPAQVTHVEATAYARFVGGRLPTEQQLRRAAHGQPHGQRPFPWGTEPPDPDRANVSFQRWTAQPIGSTPAGGSAWDVEELVGNGWEWSSSLWRAPPQFRPWIRSYPGYSQDFFDGFHRTMFGASWATPQRLCRPSFRNWFHRRYHWVFSKFRVVKVV